MHVYSTQECSAEALLQDVESWSNRKLIYVVKQSRHAYLLVIFSLSKSLVKRSDRSIDGGVSLETFVSAEIFLKRKTLKKKAAAARHIF